jgi:hypothetical protein
MESLLYLFVFLLISLSIVDLWTNSYIFSAIRNRISRVNFSKILVCPECFSFWVGLILSFTFDPLIGFPGLSHYYLSHIFCGTLTFLVTRAVYNKGIL